MSQPQPTLLQEARMALAGSWRLILGRQDAPGHFSTDQRGLVSSFIALLVSLAITFVLAAFVTTQGEVTSFAALIEQVLLYGAVMGSTWIIFRLTGFADKFVAFVTVENWVTAIVSVVLAILALLSTSAFIILFIAVVASFLARINNARLVVGMKAGQIVLLIIAQAVGTLLVLGMVAALFVPMPVPQV